MKYKKIRPKFNLDNRGSIFEIYSNSFNYCVKPKHMYISTSKKGVVRGFHQQLKVPQKKLVFCLAGEIADYAANIDPFSDEFGSVYCHSLSGQAGEGVIIGRKFAHAFECLSEECTLLYICDKDYIAEDQLGINPLDDMFCSLWKIANPILSNKDRDGLSIKAVKQILINNVQE
ncbi:dTDP-4-dehydrorhamnose 3,5-epimerase [bacterium]|nr:dTDP-4-dehydrorhamnose 3,5-epimerase [bacterium]